MATSHDQSPRLNVRPKMLRCARSGHWRIAKNQTFRAASDPTFASDRVCISQVARLPPKPDDLRAFCFATCHPLASVTSNRLSPLESCWRGVMRQWTAVRYVRRQPTDLRTMPGLIRTARDHSPALPSGSGWWCEPLGEVSPSGSSARDIGRRARRRWTRNSRRHGPAPSNRRGRRIRGRRLSAVHRRCRAPLGPCPRPSSPDRQRLPDDRC